ncbi:restriction endonuclease subunit S [Streptococcus mutans]|nr:restriction endonuclease subunit S [Streptococcus mutans]MCB5136609.1 restriction endonuclease subunit S [Streptococcus mutans]
MDEWKKVKLGDICQTNLETYSLSEKWDFVNYLDTGSLTKNVVSEYQEIDLQNDKLPSRARRKISVNDILYSTVRPNQEHYGIVKEVVPNMLVSTGFTVISVNQELVDSDFIYYCLTQREVIEHLQAIGEQSTSAYPSIKPTDIENLELFLPSLNEQREIASVLRVLDDKIENNRKINHHLEQIAQAIFKSWFVDFEPFGGVKPSDWETANLTDIAEYLNGLAMQKYRPVDDEESLPVLKIKELRQGTFDSSSDLCSANIKSQYIIQDGDVIFSWSGSLLVDFWTGGTGGLNQHLFKVSSQKYDKWFYYSWTKYYLEKFVAIAADKATTMGHITRKSLDKAKILIPNDHDYESIGLLLAPIYSQIISNRIENRKLTEVRDTLLPKLLSGEISVNQAAK